MGQQPFSVKVQTVDVFADRTVFATTSQFRCRLQTGSSRGRYGSKWVHAVPSPLYHWTQKLECNVIFTCMKYPSFSFLFQPFKKGACRIWPKGCNWPTPALHLQNH